MKKKKIIIIIIVIVVLIVLFLGWFTFFGFNTRHYPKQLNGGYSSSLPNNDVLVNYSFMNGAWSYTYYGEIVLKDGTRYQFNCTERGANNCKIKKKRSISKTDINKMMGYESLLTNNITYENHGADMGEVTIIYYKNGEEYTLAGKGDNLIKNNSTGAKKILKILKKYGMYV